MDEPRPPEPVRRGRPRSFEMARVLDAAIPLFAERGFVGTSIGDVAQRTGLTTGSLYKAFDDKLALFNATISRYLERHEAELGAVLRLPSSARERVAAVLKIYAGWSHGSVGRSGCLIIAAAVEMNGLGRPLEIRVDAALRDREALLQRLVTQGHEDGSISDGVDPVSAAGLMLCVVQGMRVVGKTDRTQVEMERIADMAMSALDAPSPKTTELK